MQLNFALHEPYASLAGSVAAAESLVAYVPFSLATQQSAAQQIDFTKLSSQRQRDAYLAPSTCSQPARACPAHSSWRGAAVTCTRSGGPAGRCCCGLGLLLAPVPLQKPRVWNWVFLSKSIFLNVPRGSEMVLWWPSSRRVKPVVGASVWVHPSIHLSVSATVQATGNKANVFTHCC